MAGCCERGVIGGGSRARGLGLRAWVVRMRGGKGLVLWGGRRWGGYVRSGIDGCSDWVVGRAKRGSPWLGGRWMFVDGEGSWSGGTMGRSNY